MFVRTPCRFPAGLIKEVAETRCGGSANLAAAVTRGDVVCSVDDHGRQLFYFPEVKIGSSTSLTSKQTMSRGKRTTETAFKMVSDMVENFGWALKVNKKSLEARARLSFGHHLC